MLVRTRALYYRYLLALNEMIFFSHYDVFECSKFKSSHAYHFTLVFRYIVTKFGHLFLLDQQMTT